MDEKLKTRYNFLKEKYISTGLLTIEWFDLIIKADPTTKVDQSGAIVKAGKYSQWLLQEFFSISPESKTTEHRHKRESIKVTNEQVLYMEDLYKVTEDLKIYDVVKRQKNTLLPDKKDINKIDSYHELYDLVKHFSKTINILTKAEQKKEILINGLEIFYNGNDWDVVIPKTKEAAVAVSGPPLTRWCTSHDGSFNYFANYANQGSLYIIRNKNAPLPQGRAAGQPTPLYQLHFETNSFMDQDDRRIDLLNIFGTNEELKIVFKSIFKRYFLNSKTSSVNYPNDNASKYISLYGFDDFFETISEDITDLSIECPTTYYKMNFKIPSSIRRFKNLKTIYLKNCVISIPDEIGELVNLENISFPENEDLLYIPDSISNLPKLMTLNLKNCSKIKIPESLLKMDEQEIIFIIR